MTFHRREEPVRQRVEVFTGGTFRPEAKATGEQCGICRTTLRPFNSESGATTCTDCVRAAELRGRLRG